MQTDVFLVRHGESYGNVQGRLCAVPPGPGLTERGRLQAEAASARLIDAGIWPTLIVSSPLARALETASPLSVITGLPVQVEAGLAETRFGSWEGHRAEELRASPYFRSWNVDPERYPPPGGERLSAVGARVCSLLLELAARDPGGTIVGFSHMHPLIGLALQARGLPYLDHGLLYLPNATIVHVRVEQGALRLVSIDAMAATADGEPAVGL